MVLWTKSYWNRSVGIQVRCGSTTLMGKRALSWIPSQREPLSRATEHGVSVYVIPYDVHRANLDVMVHLNHIYSSNRVYSRKATDL